MRIFLYRVEIIEIHNFKLKRSHYYITFEDFKLNN